MVAVVLELKKREGAGSGYGAREKGMERASITENCVQRDISVCTSMNTSLSFLDRMPSIDSDNKLNRWKEEGEEEE